MEKTPRAPLVVGQQKPAPPLCFSPRALKESPAVKAKLLRGINAYPALDLVGRRQQAKARQIFVRARSLGRPVVRINAFWEGNDRGAVTRTAPFAYREKGLRALDRVITIAREEGVQLILVTSDNWSSYGGKPRLAEWHGLPHPDAFFSNLEAERAHVAWLSKLGTRINSISGIPYKNDCTIAMWEVMNEARCDDPKYCDDETLTKWANKMSTHLRKVGVSQPISWGGSGYRGKHGEFFESIAKLPNIDVLTMHYYPDLTIPLVREMRFSEMKKNVNDEFRKRLLPRVFISDREGKTLMVEEFGFSAPRLTNEKRAEIYRSVLALAARHEVPFLPWMIGEARRKDYDGYLVGSQKDELWAVFRDY